MGWASDHGLPTTEPLAATATTASASTSGTTSSSPSHNPPGNTTTATIPDAHATSSSTGALVDDPNHSDHDSDSDPDLTSLNSGSATPTSTSPSSSGDTPETPPADLPNRSNLVTTPLPAGKPTAGQRPAPSLDTLLARLPAAARPTPPATRASTSSTPATLSSPTPQASPITLDDYLNTYHASVLTSHHLLQGQFSCLDRLLV